MNYVHAREAQGEVATGLLYLDPEPRDLHAHLNTVAQPFNQLGVAELCPGAAALARINASLR
jgi:2-oxoglutarate ferredoxin oxidoreductase subunit beta